MQKSNFEDIVWIFKCGSESRGICRLNLEEAAYLYKVVKSYSNPLCVEIGRYFGGTTILLLTAGARVLSIDNQSKDSKIAYYDRKLINWATNNGYKDKLNLVVADSTTYPPIVHDVILLDGGHEYETVRADCDNWLNHTKSDIMFHDCQLEGVKRAIDELCFDNKCKVSSIIHVKL